MAINEQIDHEKTAVVTNSLDPADGNRDAHLLSHRAREGARHP